MQCELVRQQRSSDCWSIINYNTYYSFSASPFVGRTFRFEIMSRIGIYVLIHSYPSNTCHTATCLRWGPGYDANGTAGRLSAVIKRHSPSWFASRPDVGIVLTSYWLVTFWLSNIRLRLRHVYYTRKTVPKTNKVQRSSVHRRDHGHQRSSGTRLVFLWIPWLT